MAAGALSRQALEAALQTGWVDDRHVVTCKRGTELSDLGSASDQGRAWSREWLTLGVRVQDSNHGNGP